MYNINDDNKRIEYTFKNKNVNVFVTGGGFVIFIRKNDEKIIDYDYLR